MLQKSVIVLLLIYIDSKMAIKRPWEVKKKTELSSLDIWQKVCEDGFHNKEKDTHQIMQSIFLMAMMPQMQSWLCQQSYKFFFPP